MLEIFTGETSLFDLQYNEIKPGAVYWPRYDYSIEDQIQYGRNIHKCHIQQIVTNSENIIIGIRLCVLDGNMKPEDVVIYFVDENRVKHIIHIDKYGELDLYPKGFFDTNTDYLIELIKGKPYVDQSKTNLIDNKQEKNDA